MTEARGPCGDVPGTVIRAARAAKRVVRSTNPERGLHDASEMSVTGGPRDECYVWPVWRTLRVTCAATREACVTIGELDERYA